MKLDNKTYDTLKYIALIALPALQVFWLTIGKIWNISYTVEIGATIGAVVLLLGTLSAEYRPSETVSFPVSNRGSSAQGYGYIDTSGRVYVRNSLGSMGYFSFSVAYPVN